MQTPIESQHTEWKESWREDHLRWVCGFANAEGGRLEIGRDDKGVIVGLADAPKLLEDLPNKKTLNALVHRDYAVGAPVQIRVYENRLKIWNPAVLPEGWTLENLLSDHASTPYNPDVANAFFRAGEIETWGRGIQRIFEACENAGTPAPIIDYKPNDLWLEFPYSEHYLTALGEKVGEKVGEKLTENRQMILEAIRLNPKISQKKLAAILSIATKNIETNIYYLKKHGYLRRVGSAKGGYWEVIQ